MGDSVDSSFFSALRAVVCFIRADGQTHAKERERFLTLLNGYGVSRSERRKLEDDFSNPPSLEEVFRDIYRAEDRDRLLRWARSLANADGQVSGSERQMLERLERLVKDSTGVNHREMALSLLELERQNRTWTELERFAKEMYRPASFREILFPSAIFAKGLGSTNRYIFWFTVFILLGWALTSLL